MNPEPPEERPADEPPRCRHCGEEMPDEQHQELGGCPSQQPFPEQEPPADIEERDEPVVRTYRGP